LNHLKFPYEIEKEENLNETRLHKISFKKNKTELNKNENHKIYKIPFENALNIIERMDFFLYKGFVYVFQEDLIKLIEIAFKETLNKKMNKLAKYYDQITNDDRIFKIIQNFLKRREGKNKIKYYLIYNYMLYKYQY
jgi:DNA primase large subunit